MFNETCYGDTYIWNEAESWSLETLDTLLWLPMCDHLSLSVSENSNT